MAPNSISETKKRDANDIAEYEYRMMSTLLSFDVLLEKTVRCGGMATRPVGKTKKSTTARSRIVTDGSICV